MEGATLQNLLLVVFGFFSLGAVGSLLFQKFPRLSNIWGHGCAALGSLAGMLLSLWVLIGEKTVSLKIATLFPFLELSLRINAFAAFFMLVVSTIALFASLYGIGYMAHYYGKYNIGMFGFFYNVFIASMLLVFSAQHALYFLVLWEIMSLASYMLVTFEYHEEENIKAGFTYFAMTHAATACITFAFLLLYRASGSFDFDVMRGVAVHLPVALQMSLLALALVGFGTKAGIIPLHVWLPKAHPAAPAHVSALMSGVMIKTGIFMIIRFFFEFIPVQNPWIGAILLLIGAVTSFLGVLYALGETDLKRLLAYSSIENIGIILLGIGCALMFGSLGLSSLMILALIAALYHIANHAVFKALLFFGVGSVAHATHTRNIEKYGGLIKRMPMTAFCFLIGAMAISGLPPFNGFVSEWMTFQSLFAGIKSSSLSFALVFIAGITSLAFTGGLAAACFVRALGISFLARARSKESEHAHESSPIMLVGMAGLAILSLVLGVCAGSVVPVLSRIATSVTGVYDTNAFVANGAMIAVRNNFAELSMPMIAIILIGLLIVVAFIVSCVTFRRKVTRNITWDCGSPLTARMEITATGFSRSLLTIFKALARPTKQVHTEYADAHRYVATMRSVELGVHDVYESHMYGPLSSVFERISRTAKKIQSGNVNAYILYIGLTVAALFVWISFF